MNAKLKELKLAALTKFASNHGFKLTHLGDLDTRSQEEVDALFAELIVQECAKVADTNDCNLSLNGDSIRTHFGVE